MKRTTPKAPDAGPLRNATMLTTVTREEHVRALEYLAGDGASGILNLGTGKGHTVKEVVATIERVIRRVS